MCDFLHVENTTLVWDNEQQVPFAYRKDQWIGFDDERSLKTKVLISIFFYFFILTWNVKNSNFYIFVDELVKRRRIWWSYDMVCRHG